MTALRRAFKEELESGLVDAVAARPGLAVIAVVGDGMAGTPGIAARVFTALAAGGVNVIAIAQGSSERNISFVVDPRTRRRRPTRRIHAAFQLSKIGGGRHADRPRTDVVLLGFGKVGRALADQLAARQREPGVRVVGLLDRSGYVFEAARPLARAPARGWRRARTRARCCSTLGGGPPPAATGLSTIAQPRGVAAGAGGRDRGGDGRPARSALAHGFDLVLANKKPLAGPPESYAGLLSAAAAAGRRIRYEATVGAGLPILDTFRKLVDSGDRVLSHRGLRQRARSGSCSPLVGAGRPFSEAVREAMERGYTEPDPRDDLSGRTWRARG